MAILLDEISRFTSTNALWKTDAEAIVHMFGRHNISMVWDFCENVPIGDHGGTWLGRLDYLLA